VEGIKDTTGRSSARRIKQKQNKEYEKDFFFYLLLALFTGLRAQDTITVNLPEAIQRSVSISVDAVVARNQFKSSYWGYRTYKAELLPEVTLNTTLPYYSKSYNAFQNSDGTYTFVSNDYSKIDAGVSISKIFH
jgi:hypothetical protein